MQTYKIFLAAILGLFIVSSCGYSSKDKDKEVETLINQRDQARAQLKQTQDNFIQQNKELTGQGENPVYYA